MSGEVDLILGSLTIEELDDARLFVGALERSWLSGTKDAGTEAWTLNRTDGPLHVLTAIKLAVIAEMVQRGGAEPWYVGMPLAGHPGEGVLRLYERRYALRALEPRPNAAGVLQRTCVACGLAKPQDADTFERIEGLWSDRCRACDRADVTAIPAEALDVPAATIPDPLPMRRSFHERPS